MVNFCLVPLVPNLFFFLLAAIWLNFHQYVNFGYNCVRHSIISKIQIRKYIAITFQSCDATSQSSPTVQGNNLLVTSSLEIALPILGLKGVSLRFQIYEDYLIWNKISEMDHFLPEKLLIYLISPWLFNIVHFLQEMRM